MQMIKSLQNKFPDQKVLVSLTTFNQDVDFDVECSRPFELKEMTSEQTKSSWLKKSTNYLVYSPNSMRLYDAIGKSVKKNSNCKEEIENNEATVVVVIITDGHENASIEFEFNQIQSMINELEKSENWTFSYLSSTLDLVDYLK